MRRQLTNATIEHSLVICRQRRKYGDRGPERIKGIWLGIGVLVTWEGYRGGKEQKYGSLCPSALLVKPGGHAPSSG